MKKIILKTLVGSRAHGLNKPDSDYDYRGVFITPTSEILSLGFKEKGINWVEGETDDTSYEIAHFLNLAIHSNPSILETLVSPIQEVTIEGQKLIDLFPYLWSSEGVFNAFCGYSHNQLKKFMDSKDDRPWKYAVAYIRVLILAEELLTHGTMTISVPDWAKQQLVDIRNEKFSRGFVIDWATKLKKRVQDAYNKNPNKQTDHEKVKEYLLWIRKEHW